MTRTVLISALVAGGLALAALVPSLAQTFPTRPIKIVVPYPPGGPTDVQARIVADRMAPVLGGSIIVESHAGGAGGSVGAKFVASSDPDGYTLLISQVGALTISPAIYKDTDHEWMRLLAPVALVATSPQLLVVNPALPVKTLPELLAYARANPGKVNFGSAGVGSQPHLLSTMLWSGMLAPAGTPAPLIVKLNAALNEALESPDAKASLEKLGAEPKAMSVPEFTAFMAAETRRWAAVVADAGIKAE